MRLIGFAGWSGAGKTTLLARLIPVLVQRGHRVSTVKHAHHNFDVDKPGKDSHTHRTVGASEVLISSANRWALMHELRGTPEPDLPELLAHLSPVDLVLVEGFKRDHHPKIEIYRAEVGKTLLYTEDPYIVGVASDGPVPDCPLPVIDLDNVAALADFVDQHAAPIDSIVWRGPLDQSEG
ncbi:molybdopterin-guanine dinucleotide biosynthesis protein B [Ancylobacter sp.]|uniref:molybdopterin-guanine dinucleotide biosynthesis protein B n=1 Tax=Ancylobacter sp. TaxID=1872567 RepID=UPI003D1383F6